MNARLPVDGREGRIGLTGRFDLSVEIDFPGPQVPAINGDAVSSPPLLHCLAV